MPNETLMIITGIAASIGTIIGAWFLIAKLIAPVLRRTKILFDTWEIFIRDWSGTPEEPGRDAVPGVMERLNRIDGELKHNGGSSMKDQLKRVEAQMKKADLQRKESSAKIDEIYQIVKNNKK